MKALNVKKLIAKAVCGVSMAVAENSSSKCLAFLIKEPKMPKSLYKRD